MSDVEQGHGPLLQIDDLRVSYRTARGAGKTAVEGVGLSVHPGEFVAVVGESGSGKSTTVHAALRLLPSSASIESGTIHLGGRDVTRWKDRQLAQLRGPFVGFVPQDPGTSLNPVKRVGVQVLEAIRLHRKVESGPARELALEKLRLAGLNSVERIYSQFPHELSGGMKQRVLIAIALASDPALLVADEPTSALDVTVQKVILDHLAVLRDTLGLGVLLVTHDLGVAFDRADRVVVMRQGRIVEQGETRELVENPGQEYTRSLIAAAPSFRSARLGPSPLALAARAVDDTAAAGPVLELRDVTRRFTVGSGSKASEFVAVDGVTVGVTAGSTHAVVGESGAGKSTLARIAVGLSRPDAGEVLLEGDRIDGLSHRRFRPVRRRIQLVRQNPYSSLDPKLSIEQIITEPLAAFKIRNNRTERRTRVVELLDAVALDSTFLRRKPVELSGGQRQRVAIARALAADPRIVVLDEAVSALDVSVQSQILQLLVDVQAEFGLTYLFITHDLGVVRLIADDVTVMRGGRVVESGRVDDIFGAPREAYTRNLLHAVPGENQLLAAAL
ncbi:ABC transporter ATP-binding protein [Rhodococcus sp. ACS1]|uniref:dipeptide ABC transporter ATP-binding protein n=1 Tax=Rhodococcus sp. ACS1 TaxID=2028570 RepID=UPI000BB0F748|nr:ABC transporter ATP-binding protein [Rhodococcus sp. ACS1]PBC44983.1 ABC transporter ATP-binding protein [Rhodococcus sp. ACS1]